MKLEPTLNKFNTIDLFLTYIFKQTYIITYQREVGGGGQGIIKAFELGQELLFKFYTPG